MTTILEGTFTEVNEEESTMNKTSFMENLKNKFKSFNFKSIFKKKNFTVDNIKSKIKEFFTSDETKANARIINEAGSAGTAIGAAYGMCFLLGGGYFVFFVTMALVYLAMDALLAKFTWGNFNWKRSLLRGAIIIFIVPAVMNGSVDLAASLFI